MGAEHLIVGVPEQQPDVPEGFIAARLIERRDILTRPVRSARLEPPTLTKVFSAASDSGAADEVPITVAEARTLLNRWRT
jgi:hypothetical protein